MKTLTKEEVKKIVENHEHWVNKDCRDWQDMRADFTDVYVGHMNLSGVNLSEATFDRVIFDSVDFADANLARADIRYAKFTNTTLVGVKFMSSYIYHTIFEDLDMQKAVFTYSEMLMSEFRHVNAKGSKFTRTTMHLSLFLDTIVSNAEFALSKMIKTDIDRIGISNARNFPFIPSACPDTGAFIGWKKAYSKDHSEKIVCLEIPEDAKRSSGFGRKCRCDKAKVIGIYNTDESLYDKEVYSFFNSKFVYRIGETVSVPDFCDNRFDECASGIHFFITRREALDYNF